MQPARTIHESILIDLDAVELPGELCIPNGAHALILFVHGSGSSRHSPRNQYVANFFNQFGIATLLFDLLTPEEEMLDLQTAQLRFDIRLLAQRVVGATRWVSKQSSCAGLKIAYFGASTGAAAALVAAAELPQLVHAVVSRGGRPDLAGTALSSVHAPTLLIVGGKDKTVLQLNHLASKSMRCEKVLEVIEGAGHLFEEPGALETVAGVSREWFARLT
jgi:pimeloyl-ACP methyl ester carboxylesterase